MREAVVQDEKVVAVQDEKVAVAVRDEKIAIPDIKLDKFIPTEGDRRRSFTHLRYDARDNSSRGEKIFAPTKRKGVPGGIGGR